MKILDKIAGIIGLSEDLKVYSGYDSYHREANINDEPQEFDDPETVYELASIEERRELADTMIARWKAYRDSLK